MVKVYSPGTSANLGPGYDVFGLALSEPYDIVKIVKSDRDDEDLIKIYVDGVMSESIPTNVDENTAGIVAKKMMEDYNIDVPIDIYITKGIKPGSGLGSSSASCSGVSVGLNELFDLKLSKLKLTEYASLGETAAAGVAHADNVAPAIYGGFTMVTNYNPLEVLNINVEFDLIVALPNIQISTKEAREILPKSVPIGDMVNNVGKSCGMVYALFKNDIELFGKYMMMDKVVEPYRSNLIDGYSTVKEKILKNKLAYGITISGSGPGVLIIPKLNHIGEIKEIVKEVWDCPVYHTKIGPGAYVEESK